jgi:RNA polymerase sigma-70 factor (ECF subfamily)
MEFKWSKALKKSISDEQIIALYWSRDENAIEETDRKYKNYLFSIAYNIVHARRDCEECLNDTYLAAWNAIPPSRPNMLKAFLTTIVRRIAINRYHSNLRQSEMTVSLSELEGILSEDADAESLFNARELGRVISDFVLSLPQRRRFIFMSRYYAAEPIDTIAKDLSLSRSMVNKELAAIRKALKAKLESEGYKL